MRLLLTILTALSALLGAMPFIRPRGRGGQVLLWAPKLVGGALAPVGGVIGALAALVGLARRDWPLAGVGLVGVGLAARLAADLPDVDRALAGLDDGLGAAPRPQGPSTGRLPGRGGRASGGERTGFERDVVFGCHARSGRALRADLWPPAPGQRPSGLGLIYAHGSAWRVGDKDLGTRPFFRRLAGQGHLVLDIAYSLWPAASVPEMVAEVNQAILWLKEHGPAHGVDPERIVLMGGSAGGHLALLAAYTPGLPAFQAAGIADGDTRVRGVVAFYPPADLLGLQGELGDDPLSSPRVTDRAARAMMDRILALHKQQDGQARRLNLIAEMMGGTRDEIPETYRLASPLYHVGAHCPPTLLVHGSDDVFGLTPGVRRLHESLRAAGVPCALIEFPHTEHGFDLLLPGISPMARAATRGVERFLAWLAATGD